MATMGYNLIPHWAEPFEWEVERTKVARLLHGYYWRWEGDGLDILATEQSFELPLVNPSTLRPSRTWLLAGKIDKIVRLEDGRLAIQEHKTTGDSIDTGSDYWPRLRLDQQISLYVLAARQLGFNVETVLYDVIRKPGIEPKIVDRKSGRRETADEYGDRLTEDIGTRPDFYFARKEIPRLEKDLEEFSYEVWQQAHQLRDCQTVNRWYRNTNSCLMPYRCDFFDLCSNGYDPADGVPPGFVQMTNVHPELEVKNGNACTAPTESPAAETAAEGERRAAPAAEHANSEGVSAVAGG